MSNMVTNVRTLAVVVLVGMLGLTSWASSVQALWKIPGEVWRNPWFLATLADAYCGFLFFWLWVIYKERSWLARLGWLVAILLLGNIAMAVYVLLQTWHISGEAPIEKLFLRRTTRRYESGA